MRNITKLLPVLLLGSALGGCSMAGTGDYFADQYGQQSHFWGEGSSTCQQQPQQPQYQATVCKQAYAQAPQAVNSYPYSAPVPQTYAQAVPQQQLYTGQQGYPAQQAYSQAAYVPAYVNSNSGSSRGLRQAYTYGTLGATMYDVDSDLFGAQARLGYQSKSIFGAEVEGSVGFTDENTAIDLGGGLVDSDFEVDTQIAAFAVARYPVSQKLNLLGRVGYHHTELSAEFDDGVTEFETDFSTDGIAYGVGVEYALGQRTALRADYTVYDFDGPDADALSLAIARKF